MGVKHTEEYEEQLKSKYIFYKQKVMENGNVDSYVWPCGHSTLFPSKGCSSPPREENLTTLRNLPSFPALPPSGQLNTINP